MEQAYRCSSTLPTDSVVVAAIDIVRETVCVTLAEGMRGCSGD